MSVETSFGALDVVDAHAHFFSHRFFQTLGASLAEPPPAERLYERLGEKLPFDFPPEEPEELARLWIEELDRHGVSRSVLIASVPGDEESVAAAARAYPDRFIPYFMLNPTATDAVQRTKRAFRVLGMKGVCLFPAMHKFHLWDSALVPIFEEVASHDGIVFVHCGILKVGVRDKLGLSSPFDIRYANPLDIAGAARAFDSLSFVVPHFGGGFFRELLLVASECANVYTDSSSSNSWMERLVEPVTLKRVLERTIEVVGAERVLYGSDSSFFPRGWVEEHFEAQVGVLEELGVSSEVAQSIFGGNLTRLVA